MDGLSPKEKTAWNEELQKRPLYLCDPEKNADCPKTACGYLYSDESLCHHTLNANFAKLDDEGNLVMVMSVDEL